MKLLTRAALFMSAAVFLLCAAVRAQQDSKSISDVSVWHPAPGAVDAVRKQCGAGNVTDMESCFLAAMKQQGAPNTAIAFARSMADRGQIYLKAFRRTGKVSIGYFEYVFRANETEGVALVNGSPSPIDVDDPKFLTHEMLAANSVYQQIAGKYPNVSSWPGDRTSPSTPEVRDRDSGGQQVLVRYLLKDGCHACANLGSARVAFNFDTSGKFVGVRLMNVIPGAPPSTENPTEQDPAGPTGVKRHSPDSRQPEPASLVNASFAQDTARTTAAPQTIHVNVGQDFTITLEGNRSTGYSWQLATKPDSKLIQKVAETYRSQSPGTPGAGEDNRFVFHAKSKGTADLTFNSVRPWEKGVAPAKTAKYHVLID
ncbi:MAG: protease inhibitor I42 family protein [Candidatus Acidiferrales bacterium]